MCSMPLGRAGGTQPRCVKKNRGQAYRGFKCGLTVCNHGLDEVALAWIIHEYCRALTGSFARNESLLRRP